MFYLKQMLLKGSVNKGKCYLWQLLIWHVFILASVDHGKCTVPCNLPNVVNGKYYVNRII